MNLKRMTWAWVAVLLLGVTVVGAGCTADTETPAPPAPVAETISPLKAYTLTQNNQRNPYFAIIDVRTAAEFTEEHIEGA
ncbi:MAG: rhodanese-like domain-containing protein, partial [Dehalococcoidales bacterium]|nr:rhodanese-like domain-containing protein [Dehalococcoidales bacterium]